MLLMCCMAILTAGGALAAENLLRNGDLEAGLEGWQTTKPEGATIEVVPGPRGNCARLSSSDRSASTYLRQPLDPEQIRGKRLRLEAMMRAEDVAVGTYPYSQAKITLVWNDGEADHEQEVDFLYTFGWRKVSTVWTVGEKCKTATLFLGMHTTTGTVWFDDVVLAVSELQSDQTVAQGVEKRVYDDGSVLHVDGREFTEVRPRPTQAPDSFQPTPAEASRKFVVFRTQNPSALYPGTVPSREEVIDAVQLLAVPDQYEPITFAVFALSPLSKMTVAPGLLTGPMGATIPETAFDDRMGRYVIQRVGYTSPDYYIVPKLLVTNAEVAVTPERPQLYGLTLHVPPDAPPGDYKGSVRIEADGASMSLPVTLRVPALRLGTPKPWMLFFYGSDPTYAGLYFRDMRKHGMTSVILAQVTAPLRREGDRAVVDFTTSDAFVEAYRKVGFTDPLVYNPFHDRLATILLEKFGLADPFPEIVNYGETIRVFQEGEYPQSPHETYRQVVRDIYEHAKQAQWPSMLFFPVDEPNEPGDWRLAAARLEYRLTREAVPTARTFCTVYSTPMMERLDPWLDVRACPVVPATADEKAHQAVQDYLQRAGGEIWGIDWPAMWDDFWRAREVAGLTPAKAGVTAMTAWTYYDPAPFTDEYDDLRGEFKHCLLTYRDADGGIIPTVTWEGIRAGATDWRYIATLEQAIAGATGQDRERGQRVLDEVVTEIPWRGAPRPDWGNDRAAQLRAKMADEIVRLQGAR
jgi:hypothetical protein